MENDYIISVDTKCNAISLLKMYRCYMVSKYKINLSTNKKDVEILKIPIELYDDNDELIKKIETIIDLDKINRNEEDGESEGKIEYLKKMAEMYNNNLN